MLNRRRSSILRPGTSYSYYSVEPSIQVRSQLERHARLARALRIVEFMLLQHQRSFLRYDWIESGLVKAAEDDLAKVCPGGSRHVTSKLTFSCQIYLCWMVLALFVDSTFAQKHGLVHPKLRQLVESFTISSEVIVTHPLEQLKKHAKKRLGKMSSISVSVTGSL